MILLFKTKEGSTSESVIDIKNKIYEPVSKIKLDNKVFVLKQRIKQIDSFEDVYLYIEE